MIEQKWPQTLWLVRHGQSAGNIPRDAAEYATLPGVNHPTRHMEKALSALGVRQAVALGHWFGEMSDAERPTVVLSSPYVRARETTQLILESAGIASDRLAWQADERLREKEFGVLDRLTKFGISQRFPELAEQRAHVGKFYFRPPGGESWCDVILRLRSVLDTMVREYSWERVLIVSHQ